MKTLDQESDWGGADAVERKLIRNVSLEVETENFDELLLAVKERTAQNGGYIEDSYTYNGSSYYGDHRKSADLTIRIPSGQLDEFLSYIDNPPQLTGGLQAVIDHDRGELAGDFCRGCGYCLPCPAQIDIPNCARMSLLLRRSPAQGHLSPEGQEKMARIDQCVQCNHCVNHCPYGLNTPELLRRNYEDYKTFLVK